MLVNVWPSPAGDDTRVDEKQKHSRAGRCMSAFRHVQLPASCTLQPWEVGAEQGLARTTDSRAKMSINPAPQSFLFPSLAASDSLSVSLGRLFTYNNWRGENCLGRGHCIHADTHAASLQRTSESCVGVSRPCPNKMNHWWIGVGEHFPEGEREPFVCSRQQCRCCGYFHIVHRCKRPSGQICLICIMDPGCWT